MEVCGICIFFCWLARFRPHQTGGGLPVVFPHLVLHGKDALHMLRGLRLVRNQKPLRLVLRKGATPEMLGMDTPNQLMVNCWFGARWFGFLESPYERNCCLGVPQCVPVCGLGRKTCSSAKSQSVLGRNYESYRHGSTILQPRIAWQLRLVVYSSKAVC